MNFPLKYSLYLLVCCFAVGTISGALLFLVKKIKPRAVEHGLRHSVLIVGDKQHLTLADRMKYYKTPAVSIAVIDKGVLTWAKGYGFISSCANSKKVDANTLFQACSLSKPITAMGALLLVQQGKLSLDQNVNTYLKSWKVPDNEYTQKEKVTLRRLLSHTAGTSVHGFPGYLSCSQLPALVDILDGRKPLVCTDPIRVIKMPGTEPDYSGGGTTIVQLLIEDITGEKFDKWMEKNVLIPLGMKASTFSQPLSQPYSDHAAYGHDSNGDPLDGKWHTYPEMAAAGLWTTPTDLAKFLIEVSRILHGEQSGPVGHALIKEALSPQFHDSSLENNPGARDVGLGFFLSGLGNEISFWHKGQNKGYISTMHMYPHLAKGLVVMINNDSAWGLMDEIKNSIADTYAIPGFEPIVKKKIEFDSSLLPKLTGIYKNGKHTLTINMRNNSLYLLDSAKPQEVQLYPASNNTFFMKEHVISLRFLNSNGMFDSIIMLDKDGKEITEKNFKRSSD